MKCLILFCGLTLSAMAVDGREIATASDAPKIPATEMREVVAQFTADYAALKKFHEVPTSRRYAQRLAKCFRRGETLLDAIDFDRLTSDEQIDYLLMKNFVHRELGRLAVQQKADEQLVPLVPFAVEIVRLEEARRRMQPIRPEQAAAALSRIGRQVKQVRRAVELGFEETEAADDEDIRPIRPDKVLAKRAADATEQLQGTLQRWHKFHHGFDPMFTWWAAEPYKDTQAQLAEYAELLRCRIVGVEEGKEPPLIGNPIGRDALLVELKHEMIPYTPEQLIAIGQREFAWCDGELVRAAREMGHGDDWKKALAAVKAIHAPPGKQDDLIKQFGRESIDFVQQRDLVTVPELCRELWTTSMISAKGQGTTPYMSYGGNRVNVAFPTDRMSHERKLMNMRGNNVHFTRAVVHHELIPGHHLQAYMAARHQTHRRPFSTAFYIEGWALHWEMLLWDLGFQRSAEDRIGMLFWRRHRCARIVVSLKFHLKQMEPDAMVDFLVDRVGHERDGATAEVRRYIGTDYGPLYQCAYMIGGLQIRELHKELVGSGDWTDRRFHDAVLKQNVIPIELIRARLTDQDLSADFSSRWKFAGETSE